MKHIRFILIAVVVVVATLTSFDNNTTKPEQPVLGTRSVKIIEVTRLKFKDLNKNGKLDGYEDWRLTASQRKRSALEDEP